MLDRLVLVVVRCFCTDRDRYLLLKVLGRGMYARVGVRMGFGWRIAIIVEVEIDRVSARESRLHVGLLRRLGLRTLRF